MELWIIWILVVVLYGLLFRQIRVPGRFMVRTELVESLRAARRAEEPDAPSTIESVERRLARLESGLAKLWTDFENHEQALGLGAHRG